MRKEAWSIETRIGLGVTALALAACGYLGLRRQPGESSENPDEGGNAPSIGLITEDMPDLSPLLSQQLDVVGRISGRPDCKPQIITVAAGANAEVAGICRVGSGETEGTVIVTRKAKDGDQLVINQSLAGYPQRDEQGHVWAIVLAYEDGSADDGVQPLMWVYEDGLEYVFANGMRVEFGPDEAKNLDVSFTDWLRKALGPEVAEAAEDPTATPIPTLTATATEAPPTWTSTPTSTIEFTPTPDEQTQELLFPSELSGCTDISDIDEVLALEKERISFEKNFPSVQQVVKIERYGAIVDYNTLLLFPSQSGFADSPIKPVTCSRMIVDGADVYVAGLAVRNRDGSTGFLHVMIGGTDADGVAMPVFVDLPEGIFWRATKVGVEETFGAIKDGIERIKLGYGVRNRAAFLALGLKFEVNYYDNHPELFAMMEDYFITGIVPAELESIAIPLYSVRK